MNEDDKAILRKADQVLGVDRAFSKDFGRLLHAIADGKWTPEDARKLKVANERRKDVIQ